MLSAKQVKALKLIAEATMTDREVAAEVKVSPQTLCAWKKSEDFKKEFNNMIISKIQFAAAKAYKKQVNLLNAKSEMVAHLAAKDLMDRAGYKPEDNVNTTVDMDLTVSVDYGED